MASFLSLVFALSIPVSVCGFLLYLLFKPAPRSTGGGSDAAGGWIGGDSDSGSGDGGCD